MHVDSRNVIPILMDSRHWSYAEPRSTLPGIEGNLWSPSVLYLDVSRRMVLPTTSPTDADVVVANLQRLRHEQHYEPILPDAPSAGTLLVLDGTEHVSSLLMSEPIMKQLARTLDADSLLVGIPTVDQLLALPMTATTLQRTAFMRRVAETYYDTPGKRLSPTTFFVSGGRYLRTFPRVAGDVDTQFERRHGCLFGVLHELTLIPYMAFVLVASAEDQFDPVHEQVLHRELSTFASPLYHLGNQQFPGSFMGRMQTVMSWDSEAIDQRLDLLLDLEMQFDEHKPAKTYHDALYALCMAIADATPGVPRDASGRPIHSPSRQRVLDVFAEVCGVP